jgi:hypothetical protein
MELEIFTLADFAQDNQSKLTIVGTFDAINAPQFPHTHPSCYLACRMRFGASETGEHDFRLRLIDKEGKEVIKPLEGRINISRPHHGEITSVNFVMNFNQLQFRRYSFELFVYGEWKSGLPLFLNKNA